MIRDLRENLKPKGTMQVTVLRLNGLGAFNHSFIERAINELEISLALKTPLSPLQQLAVELLFDSAGMKLKDERSDS